MSVLIKGMDMPENCEKCKLYDGNIYFCLAFVKHIYCAENGRPDWCPLVEVPTPHGALIDRDKLTGEQYKEGNLMVVEMDAIEDAPTIIEAED